MGDRIAVMTRGVLEQVRRSRRGLRAAGEHVRRRLHRQPGDDLRPRSSVAREPAASSLCSTATCGSSGHGDAVPAEVIAGVRPEHVRLVERPRRSDRAVPGRRRVRRGARPRDVRRRPRGRRPELRRHARRNRQPPARRGDQLRHQARVRCTCSTPSPRPALPSPDIPYPAVSGPVPTRRRPARAARRGAGGLVRRLGGRGRGGLRSGAHVAGTAARWPRSTPTRCSTTARGGRSWTSTTAACRRSRGPT